MIYTIKTVVGRENIVMDNIAARASTESIHIQSMMHPEEIKGYVFIEGDIQQIEAATQSIPHIRGLIKSPVEFKQIQRFLQPKEVAIELSVGDIVEVIGGPFKAEKGKITRYDPAKRECTIELVEVAVPIPITVSVELVKVLEKAK